MTSGARAAEAFARGSIAQIALPAGLYGLARQEAETALAIARAIDHREWTVMALSMLGRARLGCRRRGRRPAPPRGDAGSSRRGSGAAHLARGGADQCRGGPDRASGRPGRPMRSSPDPSSTAATGLLPRSARSRMRARDSPRRRRRARRPRDGARGGRARAVDAGRSSGDARRVEAEALADLEGLDAALPLLPGGRGARRADRRRALAVADRARAGSAPRRGGTPRGGARRRARGRSPPWSRWRAGSTGPTAPASRPPSPWCARGPPSA